MHSVVQKAYQKSREYKPLGSRGQPIKAISEENCTENERFIFEFLKKRRELRGVEEEEGSESDGSVDDDEFEAYLDSLGPKTSEKNVDIDYMKELNECEVKKGKGKKRKAEGDEESDAEKEENDWEDAGGSDVDNSSDDDLSLGDSDDLDEAMEFSSSDEEDESGDEGGKKGKTLKMLNDKEFRRKLKEKADMSSLFAAADDFADILEESSKLKNHGTLGEVANKDKSSEKQMQWEQTRHKNSKKRAFKVHKKFKPSGKVGKKRK